jgi:hypothetical protein
MTARIVLARDTGSVRLGVGAESLCVRHRTYAPPQTREGCLHLTHEEFVADHKRALAGRSVMVVVGLSKLATPGNRTRVGPLLWGPLPGLSRISVDRTLFVAEPWRAWWHFGCVGAPYREYTYSYLAESHWKAAREGVRDDPFSLEAIAECGRGVVRSEYRRFFEPLSVARVEMPREVHEQYQREKAAAFDEEHTAKAIIKRLAAFAQKAFPRRTIPTTARLFERTAHHIVQTDLAVDDWLVGELRGLVEMTDGIGAAFFGGSDGDR